MIMDALPVQSHEISGFQDDCHPCPDYRADCTGPDTAPFMMLNNPDEETA